MDIILKSRSVKGEVNVISSKSYSHRYLIASFIVGQITTIHHFCFCADTLATLHALEVLGGKFMIDGDTITFLGRDDLRMEKATIDCKASASTLRILLPLVSYFAKEATFAGEFSLFARPLKPFLDILDQHDIPYQKRQFSLTIYDHFRSDDITLGEMPSSQFVSGLLFYFALVKKNAVITLTESLESQRYVDMTIAVLREFGYTVKVSKNTFQITGFNAASKGVYEVEPDYNILSNFIALSTFKEGLTIINEAEKSLQIAPEILALLKKKEPFKVDISNDIDCGPLLFAYAASIHGTSVITGVDRLVYKESNRLVNMINELKKIGADITYQNHTVIITGQDHYEGEVSFETYKDHRIAMALTIFSLIHDLRATIRGIECVNKSYPEFFKAIRKIVH